MKADHSLKIFCSNNNINAVSRVIKKSTKTAKEKGIKMPMQKW